MTGAGRPEADRDRFERTELQQAYEDGFDQQYDYDSFALLERFAWMLDDAQSAVLGAERIAAMLDGAADALHALARARRNDLPALRALIDPDSTHGKPGAMTSRLAVMEDDSVLCANCLHELHAEGLPESAAAIVHAWLTDPTDHACSCCGTTDSEAPS